MRNCLLVLAVLTLGFAPAPLPRPDRSKADRNRLAGTWVLKQVKYLGSTTYSGAGVGTGIIYLQEEVTISEREMLVQNLKTNQQPRRIPIEVQTGQHVDFLQQLDRRCRGLYRVEGATLTICYSSGMDTVRPTSFDNNNDIVLV